jgi:hypothetical protein
MLDRFSTLAAGSELPMDAVSELQERGSEVRLFLATGVPQPTLRPGCGPRRVRDSAESHGTC